MPMERNKQEDNGCFNIHNVEFYNPAPRQIKCLSFNKKTYRLAVSRLVKPTKSVNKLDPFDELHEKKIVTLQGR